MSLNLKKSGTQIQSDLFTLLRTSYLASEISGSTYQYGMRPRNSQLEDMDIQFVTGIAPQMQSGLIKVNIYVPDIEVNGVMCENYARCQAIEIEANRTIEKELTTAGSEYRFLLDNTIQTFAGEDDDFHFVHVRINYEILNY